MREILNRIDQRLAAVGLSESAAAEKAGLSKDAIRNIRRAMKSGDEGKGVSTNTLFALAPILETSVSWLVEGTGPEVLPIRDPVEIRKMIEKIEGLTTRNIDTLVEMIADYRQFSRARSLQTRSDGQSESSTPHRAETPSR